MRIKLPLGGPRIAAALALTFACAAPAMAERARSLANAIYYDDAEIWAGGPSADDDSRLKPAAGQLTPVPIAQDDYDPLAPSEPCGPCNGADASAGAGPRGFYSRCGCDQKLFPWFAGPGDCDVWCVGPHWDVAVDGMFIRREDANWQDVAGIDPTTVDQFDYGPGARLFVTGYNYTNYGLQIGYEGVNDFHALAATATDEVAYESRWNSLEINAVRRTDAPLKLLAGFRYVQLDEDFVSVATATGDGDRTKVSNRLAGAQIGGFRDAWQLNRWITIEPFGNVGAYLNDFKREDVDVVAGGFAADKNEFTDIAFVGEAGVTSVLRINRCLALRAGYQALVLDGVGTALDASLAARQFNSTTLLYHGATFGLEYQR